jgi:thiol-disulfide isomerase/thioredoxin
LVLALLGATLWISQAGAKGGSSVWIHKSGTATLSELFQKELAHAKRRSKHVVVLFTADWCAPCHAIKDMIETSRVVQRKIRKGHFVTIDVDEWRGPAHRLIPGINPSKLPTIVRVDRQGYSVLRSGGTDLGLLSEEDTGNNLARLIDGKKPLRPAYESDPKLRAALRIQAAQRAKLRQEAKKTHEVKVLGKWRGKPPSVNWVLKLTLRNNDARRRFFAVSTSPGQSLEERPSVGSYEDRKYDEHVRAHFLRFYGAKGFVVFPVASKSFIELNVWRVVGWDDTKKWLDVWELDRIKLDGIALTFDKKVPYALKVEDASATRVQRTMNGPLKVELKPGKKHRLPLRQ